MKIIETTFTKELTNRTNIEYQYGLKIQINDNELLLKFIDGEPEDNGLGRNFTDVFAIVNAMKIAYDTGKNGEPFELEELELDSF